VSGKTLRVPLPSLRTRTDGEEPTGVRRPNAVDASLVENVLAVSDDGAVAPGPPPALDPYVIVHVEPPATVTPVT
jgi:hypothetical protein